MANKPAHKVPAPAKAVAKTKAQAPAPAPAKPGQPGLAIANAGPAALEIYETSGASRTLDAGKSTVVAACLLTTGAADSTGPLSIAARSAIFAHLVTKEGDAKVALDASSLRAQAALYGAPEIVVLQGDKGAATPVDRVTIDITPGVSVSAIVVGRGPIVNLGSAIQALFRARTPEPSAEPQEET
jgi:hypothetical protein